MERDCYFDNAKAILIILVVVGHIIEPFIQANYGLKTLYVFIYSFHIPVFVLLTGYFARYIKDYSAKEIKYIGLFLAFTILYWPLSGRDLLINLVRPYWLLWFLISLASWYILLHFFRQLKHPIVVAFFVAIVAGYINQIGYFASLSRTLVFFPFFLAGYYLDKNTFTQVSKRRAISIALPLILTLAVYGQYIDYHWLYGSYSYTALGHTEWFAGFYRIGFYVVATIISVAFLSIIPANRTIYTQLGQYTLWIFLFHGLIIRLWRIIVLNQA